MGQMKDKVIDEMNMLEIKEEISIARKHNELIVQDLREIGAVINKLIQKYGGSIPITTEQLIINFPDPTRTQKDEILAIIKEKGMATTGEIISELIKRNKIGKDERSDTNTRTIISRMKSKYNLIAQDGYGKPWKVVQKNTEV